MIAEIKPLMIDIALDKIPFTALDTAFLIPLPIAEPTFEKMDLILKKYKSSQFKRDIIKIPAYDPNLKNY